MDEGKFAADFVSANLEKIVNIGKSAFGKIDTLIQINLKTAYTDYLNNTRLKYSKSKSFFIRNQPVELYSYYVPTGIACGTKIIRKPSFKNCTEFTNRLVISGTGGSGKSVLMKHLFLNSIKDKEFAPILIELRDLNSQDKTLDDFTYETLSTYKFNISNEYVTKAKEAGHFSFFFDGFDEINPKLRSKIIKQILSLSKQFPKCPIFLSSRPDDVLSGLDDFSIFRMMSLELDEALSLVAKLPFEVVIKEKFCDDLSHGLFEKHKSFLSNPLLLSIMLLTYGENAEIPSKLSIFYNQAYEALFQRHDANKCGYSRQRLTTLDIQDFSKVFSLFSLQTYEKRVFKMSRTQCIEYIKKSSEILRMEIKPEDFLKDLLSAACLLIEDGLEIAFSHRSFQEYFVALQISNSSPDIQNKLIERYWQNITQDNVINLLQEINSDLVERVLIVPKLEVLFREIGLIRKAGITHWLKYYKYFFSEIVIEEEKIYFVYWRNAREQKKTGLTQVLHLAVSKYSNSALEIQMNDKHKKVSDEFYKLYGKVEKKSVYKTENLTIKSAFIKDLMKVSRVDIDYLSAGFEVYKMLKSKHMNSVQNFDVLLGIK